MWVFYDTDDDKKFDLVLHSPSSRLYVAKTAFKLDAAGAKTAAPEHIGRKLIRPKLLTTASQSTAVAGMVTRGLLKIMSAQDDDGISSFPHPIADHRGTAFELLEVKGDKKAVVTVIGYGSDGYLLDLDGNSRFANFEDGPKKGKIDVKATISNTDKKKPHKFDAEFAYFHRNGIAWAFYDTKSAIKGYDVVLVATKPKSGIADGGFRIDAKGNAVYDVKLKGGKLIRSSLFTSYGHKAKMKKIAPELFADTMVEK